MSLRNGEVENSMQLIYNYKLLIYKYASHCGDLLLKILQKNQQKN